MSFDAREGKLHIEWKLTTLFPILCDQVVAFNKTMPKTWVILQVFDFISCANMSSKFSFRDYSPNMLSAGGSQFQHEWGNEMAISLQVRS